MIFGIIFHGEYMNSKEALREFGSDVKIPKTRHDCLLLSGDGIFYTLQGEGPTAGYPAIFIRLHMCNLQCDWRKAGGDICDAWYTWKTDTREYWTEHELVSFDSLYTTLNSFPCRRVIFTGGEPLMQQEQILDFIEMYLQGWDIEIETNGTIVPNELFFDFGVQFNCSPKLESSGNAKKLRIVPKALERLNEYKNTVFKFVAVNERDLREIDSLVAELDLSPFKVMIMCEGTSAEVLTKRMQELAEHVKERGWRMTPRLQVYIWGNTRAT